MQRFRGGLVFKAHRPSTRCLPTNLWRQTTTDALRRAPRHAAARAVRHVYTPLHSVSANIPFRALPTETKVESGTSQSKSGTSDNLSNSGNRADVIYCRFVPRRVHIRPPLAQPFCTMLGHARKHIYSRLDMLAVRYKFVNFGT